MACVLRIGAWAIFPPQIAESREIPSFNGAVHSATFIFIV